MKLERDVRKHEDQVGNPKAVTVPSHLEPLIDLVAQLIADEKIKEIESQTDGGKSESKPRV